MVPAYISNLPNVREHACYSLCSNSGTILLHPEGEIKKYLSVPFRVPAPTPQNNSRKEEDN